MSNFKIHDSRTKKALFTSRLSPRGSLGLSGPNHLYVFDFCHPLHLQTTPRPQTTVTTTPQLSALDSRNHVLHCRAFVIPSVLPTACPSVPKRLRDGPPETQPSQVWCRQDDRPVSGSGRVKGPAGAGTRSHCMTNTEGRKDGRTESLPSPRPQFTSCFSPSSLSPFPALPTLASGLSTPLLSRELAYLSPSSPQPAPPSAGFTSLTPTTFQPTWN